MIVNFENVDISYCATSIGDNISEIVTTNKYLGIAFRKLKRMRSMDIKRLLRREVINRDRLIRERKYND